MNYYRIYLKGLYVGIGVHADRLELDRDSLWLWGSRGMVASFWLPDIDRVEDACGRVLPLGMPTAEEVTGALSASL